jgi:glycosyltransferase involved in cell wall biosynthesis
MMFEEGISDDDILWLGPVKDMEAFYRSIDLLLMTSRAEGFGMVLAEAMGHGVRCISTDVGAAPEIIGDLGVIAPVGSHSALCAGVLKEANCPAPDANRRSFEGADRVKRMFAPASIRDQYEALFRSL